MTANAEELMTPREVAGILKVSTATLENWRSLRTGPEWLKLGDGTRAPVRYLRGEVDRYLAGRLAVAK